MDKILNNIVKDINTGCWNWIRAKTPQGYGQTWISGKVVLVHRYVWEVYNKTKIPKIVNNRKMVIRHICENRGCVNPEHLKLGTYSDNANDRYKQEKNVGISKDNFIRVFKLRKEGLTHIRISKIIGIDKALVYRILHGINRAYREWYKELIDFNVKDQ